MKGTRAGLILLILALVLFLVVYMAFNSPLGQRLGIFSPNQTLQPDPTSIILPTLTAAPFIPASAITPTVQVSEPAPATGVCGETGTFKVLLLGENLPETPRRGADAIRLLRVDYDRQRVDVLALPPDLWVQTPALVFAGIDDTTLTLAYFEGKQITAGSERDKMMGATRYVAQSLMDNFDYLPTNYITLKQSVFRDLVDELGGLPINIPEAVDGTLEGFGFFSAGQQVLSGQQVVNYVRILAPANDPAPSEWTRISRQNQVLTALNAQLTSPQIITKIPGVVQQFYSNVITDLSVKQLFSLACLLGASGVNINLSELGPQLVTPGEGGILLPKTAEIQQLILEKADP